MTQTPISTLLQNAESSETASQKIDIYREILTKSQQSDEENVATPAEKETALVKLGEVYRDEGNAQGIAEVITMSRGFMSSAAKAKTAKLLRTLLSFLSSLQSSSSTSLQISVLEENINWAKAEKRIFLKHSLELRLAALYLQTKAYKPCLALLTALIAELRRLDDKLILTEVHLIESRLHWSLHNLSKAKAALTSARTYAASVYVGGPLQASLDLQSGILHAEDKDWSTSSSYFYEAFENLSQLGDADDLADDMAVPINTNGKAPPPKREGGRALIALKYLLLCKVMLDAPEEVNSLLSAPTSSSTGSTGGGKMKAAAKYAQSSPILAIRAIARAYENRSLSEFEEGLRVWRDELSMDPTIRSHLTSLYDTLLKQNLLRIVEPYSTIEIDYITEQLNAGVEGKSGSGGLSKMDVEAKLSQMILDKSLSGVLDQGRGCLILYDAVTDDASYSAAISTLEEVGKVVESLYLKTVKIG